MRRKIVMLILIIVSFLLQTSVPEIPLFVTPNLMLMLIVSFGFMNGKKTGIWMGLLCGILIDLFDSRMFGLNALLYMLIGYISGFMYKVFFDEDIKVPVIIVGICDFAFNMVFYLVQLLLGNRQSLGACLQYRILPEVAATILLTLIFYKLLFYINKKLNAHELEEQQSPWLGR